MGCAMSAVDTALVVVEPAMATLGALNAVVIVFAAMGAPELSGATV